MCWSQFYLVISFTDIRICVIRCHLPCPTSCIPSIHCTNHNAIRTSSFIIDPKWHPVHFCAILEYIISFSFFIIAWNYQKTRFNLGFISKKNVWMFLNLKSTNNDVVLGSGHGQECSCFHVCFQFLQGILQGTLNSAINIGVCLLIFGLFSRGYVPY